jgi:hypothetical protein
LQDRWNEAGKSQNLKPKTQNLSTNFQTQWLVEQTGDSRKMAGRKMAAQSVREKN